VYRNHLFQDVKLYEGEGGPVEEGQEEVDDVDRREKDVNQEVSRMKFPMSEYRHNRQLQ
jgi:hypothetical protein